MKCNPTLMLLCAMCSLLILAPLKSEIEEVKITWRAAECPPGCASLLATEFGKIYGVAEVNINQPAGEAVLKWKPKVPFSFAPINTAMRMIGPRFHNLRVKVRGKIHQNMNITKIVSEGDGTEFYLLNPVTPVAGEYVEIHSPFNRQLTPDTLKKLLNAESKKQMTVIEGPLFEPFRSPPLQLVIENLQFEEDAKK